jgi:hypothetical protein
MESNIPSAVTPINNILILVIYVEIYIRPGVVGFVHACDIGACHKVVRAKIVSCSFTEFQRDRATVHGVLSLVRN